MGVTASPHVDPAYLELRRGLIEVYDRFMAGRLSEVAYREETGRLWREYDEKIEARLKEPAPLLEAQKTGESEWDANQSQQK